MNTLTVVLVVVAAIVACIDWWSVMKERPGAEYFAKPLVIVVLVGVALAIDGSDDPARGLVVAALGASLVGDVVLMAPEGPFAGGLGAFLVAHVLYIGALSGSVEAEPALAGLVIVVGLALGVVPQLLGAVRRHGLPITIAVAVYIVAVSATAVVAVGTGEPVAAIGGMLFLASDALLGWGRFVGPAPGGRTLVHMTYHSGQLGLVLWLAT